MTSRWRDRMVSVAGHRLHLRQSGDPGGEGDQPPLLVLHDAGAESVDAPAWRTLAEVRPVVQLLLPGIGDSDPVPDGADLPWMTRLLADLIAQQITGLTTGQTTGQTAGQTTGATATVDLVGTSLGGWFAVETALAHPHLVRRLLLLDTAGLHSPTSYLFGLFADGQGTGGHDGLLGPLMRTHGLSEGGVAAAVPYVATMTAAALHSWNAHTPDPSLLVRISHLIPPLTVMWGEDDALIPVAHGRALVHASPPGTRLVVVPDAGHLLAIDAPHAVVAEVAGRSWRGDLPSDARCP